MSVQGFRKYRNWELGEFVVVFADTAAGGIDFCAAQFLSKTNLDVPLVFHQQVIATEMTPKIHTALEDIFDQTHIKPVVAFERNNGGVFEMERLASLNRNGKYTLYQMKSGAGTMQGESQTYKYGYDTNSATRPAMLGMLKDALDAKLITIYDRPTVNEMFSFVVKQTSSSWKASAESGAHDDLIMSLAGAWQLYQSERPEISMNPNLYQPEQLFTADGFYGT